MSRSVVPMAVPCPIFRYLGTSQERMCQDRPHEAVSGGLGMPGAGAVDVEG